MNISANSWLENVDWMKKKLLSQPHYKKWFSNTFLATKHHDEWRTLSKSSHVCFLLGTTSTEKAESKIMKVQLQVASPPSPPVKREGESSEGKVCDICWPLEKLDSICNDLSDLIGLMGGLMGLLGTTAEQLMPP